jgi:hypothetical protein
MIFTSIDAPTATHTTTKIAIANAILDFYYVQVTSLNQSFIVETMGEDTKMTDKAIEGTLQGREKGQEEETPVIVTCSRQRQSVVSWRWDRR